MQRKQFFYPQLLSDYLSKPSSFDKINIFLFQCQRKASRYPEGKEKSKVVDTWSLEGRHELDNL